MAANLERFSKDLERLIREGLMLELAMIRDIIGEAAFLKQVKADIEKRAKEPGADFDKEATLKANVELPDFKVAYEAWYSEALALIGQLLPERLENFKSFYEKPRARKSVQYGNYVMQDYLQNLTVRLGGDPVVEPKAALPQFRQQLAIVQAAKKRFESSLFEIRQLVQAELFDHEIESARELLKSKFVRAAGMVAGVVLEKHLRQVCEDHKLKASKKNPGIADLSELLKSNSVISVPQWRQIGFLADVRNLCGHAKSAEPTPEQVGDLIDGVQKVLKTVA
ncbi:MAG: hypothetical protein KF779_19025 [Hyphomonadaceae bacterium]|nr:hypothetical protein [Hyphomonadaceae bacterium]